MEQVHHLRLPGGRIAYTDRGAGRLVVLAPGMGDVRAGMEPLARPLLDAGHRVVVCDVRGAGDSDPFREHGDEATAGDLEALVEHLGERAVVAGNSFAGSAAVILAARRPDLVDGVVLVSPFLRETASPAALTASRLVLGALLRRPWGVRIWRGYQRLLARGVPAPELLRHFDEIARGLRRPGRLAQLRRIATTLDHHEVEPYVPGVAAPALVVVGALDPDYADPTAEAAWMGERLHAEVVLVPEAGHYPHAQRPELVAPRVVAFVGATGA